VADGSDDAVLVTYWMNRLQGLDERVPLFVTLNGGAHINPDTIIAEMDYTHPIYEPAALAAQRRLGELNTSMTAFAGAYQGWGFHEDGARSGVAAAQALGVSW
jgi:predicted NAD/FAD-binding protein